MDTELAALAASGATTLVSLMVTDSWAQARELVGRLISRNDPGVPPSLTSTPRGTGCSQPTRTTAR